MSDKITLDKLCAMSPEEHAAALDSMTLGEMLALTGLTLEVERADATPEENAAVASVLLNYRPVKE